MSEALSQHKWEETEDPALGMPRLQRIEKYLKEQQDEANKYLEEKDKEINDMEDGMPNGFIKRQNKWRKRRRRRKERWQKKSTIPAKPETKTETKKAVKNEKKSQNEIAPRNNANELAFVETELPKINQDTKKKPGKKKWFESTTARERRIHEATNKGGTTTLMPKPKIPKNADLKEASRQKLNLEEVGLHTLYDKRSSLVEINHFFKNRKSKLSKEIANDLIKKDRAWIVTSYFEFFEKPDKQLALLLIKKGKMYFVIERLDDFEDMDKDMAITLIKLGRGYDVLKNKDKFKNFDPQALLAKSLTMKLVMRVLDGGYGYIEMTEDGEIDLKIPKVNFTTGLAIAMIEGGASDKVSRRLDWFYGLDFTFAEALIKEGLFDLLEKWLKSDPEELTEGQSEFLREFLDKRKRSDR